MKFWSVIVMSLLLVTSAKAGDPAGATISDSSGQAVVAVHFDTDKADIKAEDLGSLQELAKRIINESLKIVVVGHADERGRRVYNLVLGQRRACSVAAKLLELGVPEDRILALSYGEEQPAAPHGIREHLATNRRVELLSIEPLVKEVEVKVVKPYKNRLALYGGFGPSGLDRSDTSYSTVTSVVVDQDYTGVFGIGYSRNITNRFSLGGIAFTNNSYVLSFGLDF